MQRVLIAFALVLAGCGAASDGSRETAPATLASASAANAVAVTGAALTPMSVPDNEVDITGKPLQMLLNYTDIGASSPSDHNMDVHLAPGWALTPGLYLLMNLPISPLPDPLSKTPVSSLFDNFWSGAPPDPHALSVHDQAVANIRTQISKQSQISSINGISLPTTGSLGVQTSSAAQDDGNFGMDYVLSGATVDFQAGPLGATWRLQFDIDVRVNVTYTTLCTFVVKPGTAYLENVSISPTNAGATVDQAVGGLLNQLQDQPANIFQSAVGSISSTTESFNTAPIGTLFAAVNDLCHREELPLGFTELSVSTDGAHNFNMRFTHPTDGAPGLFNADKPSVPSLLSATIGLAKLQAQAGGTDTVGGEHFSPNEASAIAVGWSDPVHGSLKTSYIRWGLAGGAQTTVTKARSDSDNQNSFLATGLAPNTNYTFMVEDCETLTCSPWSSPLTINTSAASESLVDLYLVIPGRFFINHRLPPRYELVGTATVSPSGTFTSTITVPAATAPGTYDLVAEINGTQIATTQIEVIAANQAFSPELYFYDASTGGVSKGTTTCSGTPCEVSGWGSPIPLRGEGFAPGPVTVSVTTVSGPKTFSATADASGTFTVTVTAQGFGVAANPIVATQSASGQALSSSVTVMFESAQ